MCFDGSPQQLIAGTRLPLPARPDQPACYDYEYQRKGSRNLFLFFNFEDGWRHVAVTEHRTSLDLAHQMQRLVDECYPTADPIRVVLDTRSVNTHRLAALYEAFAPAEARRIARKLEFHYTPNHASWLNMAELELSVFDRPCWDRRIPDADTLQCKSQALEAERNAARATIHWRFTSQDARSRMHRLYSSVSD